MGNSRTSLFADDRHRKSRRELLAVGGACVVTAIWPSLARPTEQNRIAIVVASTPVAAISETKDWPLFFGEMRRLGYAEGHNLLVERYSAEGHLERLGDLAREAASRNPAVIVTEGNTAARACKEATQTIPIVATMGDPLKAGLVVSLSHPGGNLTGVTMNAGIEIWGKRLQILKEVIPSATTVAFLARQDSWDGASGRELRDAGQHLGISLLPMVPLETSPREYERLFSLATQQHADATVVDGSAELYDDRGLIIQLAETHRLPAIYPFGNYVAQGGLIAYTNDVAESLQQLVSKVHQILSGVKPADIPIYQPTRFALVINLKAARTIGLIIPDTLLARADEVIE